MTRLIAATIALALAAPGAARAEDSTPSPACAMFLERDIGLRDTYVTGFRAGWIAASLKLVNGLERSEARARVRIQQAAFRRLGAEAFREEAESYCAAGDDDTIVGALSRVATRAIAAERESMEAEDDLEESTRTRREFKQLKERAE